MLTIVHVAAVAVSHHGTGGTTTSHQSMLNMAVDPPATARTMIGALNVLPTVTQALALDPVTQTGAVLTTAGATLTVPIEMEPAQSSATIHDIMNNVLNFVTTIKAGVINGLAPGVMTRSHATLMGIIVLRAMLTGSQVILNGIIALHAALIVLTGLLTELSGLIHKILAGRVALQGSTAILFRINSLSTRELQKMNNLKGITNVLMARSIKDAQRFNLTRGRGVKLLRGTGPRQKNGMSLAYLTGVFSRDLARPHTEMPSSGREEQMRLKT